ncbi:hypothetical protein AHF37_06639 [Paragonimus kellicotti]|nr:hypothetical protein AHF37_06639 [Paragonimus kellicotti]
MSSELILANSILHHPAILFCLVSVTILEAACGLGLQFVASSDVELSALEQLADLIDRVANQLESDTVPITQTQTKKLISAAQLFAHEASLRLECLQRQWLDCDSVASAVLPAHPQLSERRRSLSTGTLHLNSSSHSAVEKVTQKTAPDNKDSVYSSKALKVGWIMLERRLREVNAANNSRSLADVKQLLEVCESRGQQLRALQISNEKWNQWLRINHALESENIVLESLIRLLGPPDVGWTWTELKENRNPSTDNLPSPSAGDLIAKLRRFTTTQITPIFNRLPLRGFTTDADEADLPLLATGNVERFVASSDVELSALEQLADLIDRVANQLESDTVPITQTQTKKLISAAQLFAHEASLRLECLQRQWLDCVGSHT